MRGFAALAALAFALLAPFLGKDFNIDDPLFLWAAEQIRSYPGQPYSSTVNWYGSEVPMWAVMQNPPLHSYYLALAGSLLGTGEVAMHLAMLLPTLLCLLAVYDLAGQMRVNRVAAVVWTLATPAFLVSASTVMCDVPMLACWCWACALWVRGIEGPDHRWLAAAAVCAGLACWTKYFGVACVPLLFAYGWLHRRKLGLWMVWLAMPLLMLLAWDFWAESLYDVSHAARAAGYSQDVRSSLDSGASTVTSIAIVCSFVGGSLLTPLALVWVAPGRRRTLLVGTLLATLLVAASALARSGPWKAVPHWLQYGEWFLFVLGGVSCLALAVSHWARWRDPNSALLALWIGGTFCFVAFFWTVAGRTVLPMAPALALLLARYTDGTAGWDAFARWRFAIPTAVVAALAALLLWTDARWAASMRTAAHELGQAHRQPGGQLWFLGHWGLQYYLEQDGARPLQLADPRIGTGDRLLRPHNNTNLIPLSNVQLVERRTYPHPSFVGLMKAEVGAGFYSSLWGPLPFSFGRVLPETYDVLAPKPDNPLATSR